MTTLPATQPATNAPAHGRRDLAWLASNLQAWTIERAREMAGIDPIPLIAGAVERIEAELAPVPVEPVVRKAWESALDERLRRLAVKISPGMSAAQGDEWRKVMVDALSDLPAMVALTAAKKAIHAPMQFMNQVEPAVRAAAAEIIERRRLAILRLSRLREGIERVNQHALTDRVIEPLTLDEIRRMSPEMRRIGLRTGSITQADIDAADAIGRAVEVQAAFEATPE